METIIEKQKKIENQQKNGKTEDRSIVWLRSKHVREMLKISDSTLQSMRISGAIPSYRLGSSWFYREDEILMALDSGKTKK